MSNIFKTPVSMEVTEHQYENDLKGKLEKLGYDNRSKNFETYRLLVTNAIGIRDKTSNYNKTSSSKNSEGRHFIDHYNPELFLALAGMTGGEVPIVGEWLNYGGIPYEVESIGKQRNSLDTTGAIDINNPTGTKCFTKVTKEELIFHFSKNQVKTKPSLKHNKPTEVKKWDVGTYVLQEQIN